MLVLYFVHNNIDNIWPLRRVICVCIFGEWFKNIWMWWQNCCMVNFLMDCNESCLVCQINQLDDGIMCYCDEYLPLKNKTSLCLKRVISWRNINPKITFKCLVWFVGVIKPFFNPYNPHYNNLIYVTIVAPFSVIPRHDCVEWSQWLSCF